MVIFFDKWKIFSDNILMVFKVLGFKGVWVVCFGYESICFCEFNFLFNCIFL